MNKNKNLIKELNSMLKGINMGEDTFKIYKDKAKDESLKSEIEEILSIFNSQKGTITSYIEKLGGDAKESLGVGGEIASTFEKLKDAFLDKDKDILNHALKAVDMGVRGAEEVVNSCKKINTEDSIMKSLNEMLDQYKDASNRLQVLSKETV